METKLFSDLMDDLDKVGSWLKSATNLPKSERDAYRDRLDETYTAIDTAFVIVIARLRDILDPEHADRFDFEVRNLETTKEWIEVEQKVRLCASLRATRKEMSTLAGTSEWDNLKGQLDPLLVVNENTMATYIVKHLRGLAENPTYPNAKRVMDSLSEDRRKLIKKQSDTYYNLI